MLSAAKWKVRSSAYGASGGRGSQREQREDASKEIQGALVRKWEQLA